jgi:hypothetical protein
MKSLVISVMLAFSALAVQAADAPKKEQPNCVTKDKKGNCPAAPKSPKPTPKKKVEAK